MVYPPYEEAVEEFKTFLISQKLPKRLAWITPEQTVFLGTRWFVEKGNFSPAAYGLQEKYAAAAPKPFGIKFAVCGVGNEASYCYFYAPKDSTDADYNLMGNGLKFSVPIIAPQCKEVSNRFLLFWLRLWELKYLPWKEAMFE